MTNKKKETAEADLQAKICFVIMPISNQSGYESSHFSLVYEDIIKPAVEAAGMKAVRADETVNTNLIQLDILRKVIESDIAICDMSSKNPNVFYELGVRQAFDKPTVLMIDDVTPAPFDVSSLRYVEYKKDMGYRDVKLAIEKLTQTIIETYEKKDDKSEINSLIRLMELTTPAQLNQTDISAEDRAAIQVNELTAAVHSMQATQNKILKSIESDFSRPLKVKTYDSRTNSITIDDILEEALNPTKQRKLNLDFSKNKST
ncbi:hypothetical protein [Vibrio parahaemolyticus]|uniref:hypothetical protein n=1 Tax=Vibrio parahaemolyticus TaxID=670 RepID=UPI00111D33E6|nr:hypothetical protein [Vibrio parahaemolyticus]ELA8132732.1 hypothetical protein [Vibrio parahaemolyticus]TOK52041.1 hypothetical protein CGI17_21525 [Vibrio parahaemolyticus]TOK79225.1 hypothetical protein CGI11_17100 [Vibrio parahaemolyticus]TOK80331.1 hypothetical protein CGI10_23885 [Vibrio parahaemolyticus]TOM93939.1 hypothetical protein CGH65_24980 [Vibrio parahaemolyticus]